MNLTLRATAVCCAFLLALQVLDAQSAKSDEIYRSAYIDATGKLAIIRTSGTTVLVDKASQQKSFGEPQLSPTGTAVGAQAMFENCCTSYDLPLQLVIYANGKAHRFAGNGWPIFHWGFSADGTRVAYGQEPAHFGCGIHYELRDIQTEKLIEEVDVPEPCGQRPDPPPVTIPEWVAALRPKRS